MTRYNKKTDTKHIRDASPEQARQLAYHYYQRAKVAEAKVVAAVNGAAKFKTEHAHNLMAMASTLDAIRELVCPEGE